MSYLDDNKNFEAVDIKDIYIKEPTKEATTLFDLLPSLPQATANFKLKEPIKDKRLIAFMRLVYEASKKASKLIFSVKPFCISTKQTSEKLNISVDDLKKYILDLNVTIVYKDDDKRLDVGKMFEALLYDDDTFYFSLITSFDKSEK